MIGKLAHANSDQFSPFQNDEKTLKRTVKKDNGQLNEKLYQPPSAVHLPMGYTILRAIGLLVFARVMTFHTASGNSTRSGTPRVMAQ